MGFLQDRKILVTGLLSNRSIAYGIAKALAREGAALAFTYQSAELRGRVEELAGAFGSAPVLPCDVARDDEIAALFDELRKRWGGLDGIVHSIAYAPREALKGDFLDGLTRDAFRIAHDVSSYSFAALAKAGLPLMEGRKAAAFPTSSVVTLRRSGALSSTNFSIFPKPLMPAAASVLIGPAEIPLTRMPFGPRSCAR